MFLKHVDRAWNVYSRTAQAVVLHESQETDVELLHIAKKAAMYF